uniref:tRNA (guanine(6)-N2)-methyltransferase THUMP3 isoform X2 n=1 Tax=Pristiophorus japonicus TaxID=55135 RepID=UPI00398E50CF
MSVLNGDADGLTAAASVTDVEDGPVENGAVRMKQSDGSPEGSITVGATVPTGFENTAADEVREKIGSESRISKDRGRIYFPVSMDNLFQVHLLRSVDNLFVVVQEFPHYQFDESKENVLEDFRQLAGRLLWTSPLEVWELNNSLKKRKFQHSKGSRGSIPDTEAPQEADENKDAHLEPIPSDQSAAGDGRTGSPPSDSRPNGDQTCEIDEATLLPNDAVADLVVLCNQAKLSHEELPSDKSEDTAVEGEDEGKGCGPLRFRVTCNRAGEKHSFTSMEAAREFGGAVQDLFQWKADMTKFDVEILLNIHDDEVVVGIALTEESLHRRNITHFGPTTLRSTLAYGMLRLCNPQSTDIIIDPMCGTGAIPIEDRLQEKKLGPVSSLPEGNGACVQTRDWQSCSSNAGQEMLRKGHVENGPPLEEVSHCLGERGRAPCCCLPAETHRSFL